MASWFERHAATAGWTAALVSAAGFGTSGSFGRPLLEAGWSSAALVAVRLGIASVLLLIPAIIALRGRWYLVRRQAFSLLGYGLFAGVLPQVSFFNAVQRIPVGIGLLLEYLGIVWVVAWAWLRTRHRPGRVTLVGMGTTLAGLLLILNPFQQLALDPIGVLWGLLAGVGLAVYFVLSAEAQEVPSVAFVCLGLGGGAIGLTVLGSLGLLPMAASTSPVAVLGLSVPWWLPVLELAVIAAALAYLLGFIGAQWLGATTASFVGLTEVVFAVLWAWLLLAELPGGWQLLGGLVLLGGVAVVRLGSAAQSRSCSMTTCSRPGPTPMPESRVPTSSSRRRT